MSRRLRALPRAAAALTALALVGCGSSGSDPSSTGGSASGSSGSTGPSGSSGSTSSSESASSTSSKGDPTAGTASSCVRTTREAMTPTQQAGQLIMAAMNPGPATGLDPYIKQQGLGNMLYLGGWQDVSTIKAASDHLQQVAPTVDGTKVGMLIAADQEGGEVQQLTGRGFSEIPSGLEQAQLPDLRSSAKEWGQELKAAGVNVNLAPVADTVPAEIGTANDPIGQWDRQYGSTPQEVTPHVLDFMLGMQDAGVQPVVKHFPGIGRITGNTDLTAQGVTDEKMTSDDPHLKPFAKAIDRGAKMVMVGSARYPKIDGDTPAIFSEEIITGMLREDLGFDGVVITDDVGAANSVAAWPVDQRATKVIAAGGDIILTAVPSQVPTMVEAITTKAEKNPAFEAKVESSVTRVLSLKEDMGLLSCG